jgi:hypothetical protein
MQLDFISMARLLFRLVMAVAWKKLNKQKRPYLQVVFSYCLLLLFSLSPIHLSKMCLEMPSHILVLPITDFGSCYTHFGQVIDTFWASSIFFEKKMDQAMGRKGKKKQAVLLYCLESFLCLLNNFGCCFRGAFT